jgi:type IV pilus assembly protein PilB
LHAAPAAELDVAARRAGMKTLRQSGLMKVIEGTTTVEEVLRVTLA